MHEVRFIIFQIVLNLATVIYLWCTPQDLAGVSPAPGSPYGGQQDSDTSGSVQHAPCIWGEVLCPRYFKARSLAKCATIFAHLCLRN